MSARSARYEARNARHASAIRPTKEEIADYNKLLEPLLEREAASPPNSSERVNCIVAVFEAAMTTPRIAAHWLCLREQMAETIERIWAQAQAFGNVFTDRIRSVKERFYNTFLRDVQRDPCYRVI